MDTTVEIASGRIVVMDAADEAVVNGLGDIISDRNAFRSEVQRLHTVVEEKNARINDLARENEKVREALAEANRKLQHTTLVFGGFGQLRGTTRPNRPKLTIEEVTRIRDMKRAGHKQVDLADAFDVNAATISRIVRGQYYAQVR